MFNFISNSKTNRFSNTYVSSDRSLAGKFRRKFSHFNIGLRYFWYYARKCRTRQPWPRPLTREPIDHVGRFVHGGVHRPEQRRSASLLNTIRVAAFLISRRIIEAAGQVRYGGIRRSSASPRPPCDGTPSASVWPSPRQAPGPSCPVQIGLHLTQP